MAFWSDATSKNGVVSEVKSSIGLMCMNYSPVEQLFMDQTWVCLVKVVWDELKLYVEMWLSKDISYVSFLPMAKCKCRL